MRASSHADHVYSNKLYKFIGMVHNNIARYYYVKPFFIFHFNICGYKGLPDYCNWFYDS